MIDIKKQRQKEQEKAKQRKRMNVKVDPANYIYYPERKQTDYYDNDIHQRVVIYVRVSTDDVKQTTSYELQKKYYEDFVVTIRTGRWCVFMPMRASVALPERSARISTK